MSRRVEQIKTRDGQSEASVFQPDSGDGPWPAVLVYMDGRGIRPGCFELGVPDAHRALRRHAEERAAQELNARATKATSGRRAR